MVLIPVTVTPESFIRAVDYVVHDSSIKLAHFFLKDDNPVGTLTNEPCYTLCGGEYGASVSTMFDLAKTGEKTIDREIINILNLSKNWNRQLIPEIAIDALRLAVEAQVRLGELDMEIDSWSDMYYVSPKHEEGYATNKSLQSAQKYEDHLESKRAETLAEIRQLEQIIVTKYGFDLDRYPTIQYGDLGDSTPWKMDHVMKAAEVHAIEYYFNPTKLNKMAFNTLKPLHDKQRKELMGVFEEYMSIDARGSIKYKFV
ncbi:MAG: hypothetical protein ACP5N2_03495 [Candidatus Nanoarchaeia archaeon]